MSLDAILTTDLFDTFTKTLCVGYDNMALALNFFGSSMGTCGVLSIGLINCDDKYIGETSRTFGEKYKEHLKDASPIHYHNNQTNHSINHNNFKLIGREGHHLSRYIKESIFIRVKNPTLNNNVGKFNLPHL